MNPTRARRLLAAAALSAGLVAAAPAAGMAAAGGGPKASPARVTLQGTAPSWATASRRVAAPAARTVTARVYLAGRNPAGLAAYAAAVSDPRSRDYRRYLTAAQLRQRFGPAATQVAAVRRWLTGAGLTVTAANQHFLAVAGPIPAAMRAFAVAFAEFSGPAGTADLAPQRSASIPASVGGAVLTVTGLDSAAHAMRPQLPGPPPAFYRARPCSGYYGQRTAAARPEAYGRHVPWLVCGYTPRQLRGAYGVAGTGLTGKGVSVAIVDAYVSPTMPGDANRYAAAVGEKPFRAGQYQQLLPGSFDALTQCAAASWYPEQSLDIEAVHAMAPDAKITYVAASDCTDNGLLDALTKITDHRLANVVSNSWGQVEQGITAPLRAAYDQVFQEGAAEGIGFDFSAGDCGYENPATGCGAANGSRTLQVDYPTSSPWVTSVGGTSLAVGSGQRYRWETGWGDAVTGLNPRGTGWQSRPPGSYLYGSGGGTSTWYAQPAYQARVVPDSLSMRLPGGRPTARRMREVPDVAADADPQTGFLYGETDVLRNGSAGFHLSRIGGTSLAAPLFAGLEADAAQASAARTLGFANPLLYQLAGSPAFHDVTGSPLGAGTVIAVARNDYASPSLGSGTVLTTLRTLGVDGFAAARLAAAAGYDDVTGIGSVARGFFARVP